MSRDDLIAGIALVGVLVFIVTVTVGHPYRHEPAVIVLLGACFVAVTGPGIYFWIRRH